jgi:hypothetical protein
LFEVLAFDVFVLSVAVLPSLVLDSPRVNWQVRTLVLWTVALAANAAANSAVLVAGWGSMAVAVNDVWIQSVVVIALFALAWTHLGDSRGWWSTVGLIAVFAVLTGGVAALLHPIRGDSSLGPTLAILAGRIFIVAAVWLPVANLCRGQLGLAGRRWRRAESQ